KDAAHCRVIPPDLMNKAVALKLEAPDRSVQQIIRILELTGSCSEGFLGNQPHRPLLFISRHITLQGSDTEPFAFPLGGKVGLTGQFR
ncbi:MAG: hypothetical protein ACOY4Q_00565, partial [Bacillota bacterium]